MDNEAKELALEATRKIAGPVVEEALRKFPDEPRGLIREVIVVSLNNSKPDDWAHLVDQADIEKIVDSLIG